MILLIEQMQSSGFIEWSNLMPHRTQTNDDVYNDVDMALYNKMLNLSQSAIITLDNELRFLKVTESISGLVGYDADTLIGKSYIDLIAPGYQETFHKLIKDSAITQFDYPLVNKEEVWCWVRHSGEINYDTDPVCYDFVIQNVSHYKRPRDHVERELNLLRDIIDALPAAIYANDKDGQYIFSNPAHAQLLGKARPADILGQGHDDVLPEETHRYFDAQGSQVLEQGQTIVNEELLYLTNDDKRWLNTTKMPMRDAKGIIRGVIGIARDVTEQKVSQQKLAMSEARHRALLGALPDLMFVVRRDGTITEFRSTPEVKALGVDESAIGKKFTEAGFPQPLVDEAQLYLDIALDSQYIQSFEFGGERESILEQTRGNYYEARLVRLNDEEVMALVRDITELKRVQEELSRHVDDLTIVRQVNIELSANLNVNYVAQLALDAALRLSNAQAGYLVMVDASGDLKRMGVFGRYDIEKLDELLAMEEGIIPRVIQSKTPELISDVHSVPDYVPMLEKTEAMIVVPLNSNERIVGVLVLEARNSERFSPEQFQFLQLITGRIAAFLDNASLYRQTQEQLEELKQLYAEVQYLEQLKTDMIRIASHDLKNPLGGIMGYMQMLRLDAEEKLSEQERSYLDKIELATQKMERITKGILSLERIQQLSEQQTRESVDLKELVHKSVSEHMDFAVRNEQQLKRHLPEEDVFISVDSLQMYEALSNLVHNAIKYTPRHGKVDVSLKVEDDIAKVRVKDTGYGVPKDLQKRLFDPFYRAKTTETRFIEGTGLGLHLVKNIIERHHGQMVFESVYGEGSTFGFDIPIRKSNSLEETKQ